jgi:hypothetical protein
MRAGIDGLGLVGKIMFKFYTFLHKYLKNKAHVEFHKIFSQDFHYTYMHIFFLTSLEKFYPSRYRLSASHDRRKAVSKYTNTPPLHAHTTPQKTKNPHLE